MKRVSVGDLVQDKVTGFKGTVTALTLYLNGCVRVVVQPPVDKDGKHPDAIVFDEPQLKILKAGHIEGENKNFEEDKKSNARKTGGPTMRASSCKALSR